MSVSNVRQTARLSELRTGNSTHHISYDDELKAVREERERLQVVQREMEMFRIAARRLYQCGYSLRQLGDMLSGVDRDTDSNVQ